MAEIEPEEKAKMLDALEARGKLRGFREGRIQGSLKMLLELVADGLLPIEAALERAEKWLAAYDNSEGPEMGKGERTGVGDVLNILEGRGFAEGREEGRVMGGKSMLVELVVDGLLPADAAAAKAGMDEIRFRAVVAMIAANKP